MANHPLNSLQRCSIKPHRMKPITPPSLFASQAQDIIFSRLPTAKLLSSSRLCKKVSASVLETSVESSDDSFKLTYYEVNSWLWEVGGVKILVDPLFVGNLDFGRPWLYRGSKKFLKNFTIDDIPEIDCILITNRLDDHCHLKTLKSLSQMMPDIRVIATPNAKKLLDPLFSNVTYLEPCQCAEIKTAKDSSIAVRSTAGPIFGPPWLKPENAYLVTSPKGHLRLYYEPHCIYDESHVREERADIIITPVIKQIVSNYKFVCGQEDAVRLAKLLNARFVVPMNNGDLDSKGLLSRMIRAEGTVQSFKELLLQEIPNAKVLEPTPGVPLEISFSPSSNIS